MENLLDTRFLKVYNNEGWMFTSRKAVTVAEGNRAPDAVVIWGRHIQTNRVPVIRQYRRSINDYIWELPAGLVEPGESPVVAAERELREETGLYITKVHGIISGFPSIGMSDEIQTIVRCDVNGEVTLRHGVEDEDITLSLWNYDSLQTAIKNGDNIDGRLAMLFLMNAGEW